VRRSKEAVDVVGSIEEKVGASLAARIADEINADGCPAGQRLGSEQELMERYSVSRAGMREAIRLIEQQGLAEMRRGRGGGLVVTAPEDRGVVRAMVNYLTFRRIRPKHLLQARRTIGLALLPLVVERMNGENEHKLRTFLHSEEIQPPEKWLMNSVPHRSRGFHTTLASLTGNPALELFVRSLESLVARAYFGTERNRLRHLDNLATVHERHIAVAEALIARDLALATLLFEEHQRITAEMYATPPPANCDRVAHKQETIFS
jgi:DNA-binding FadR family transcriptional regulator